MLSDVKRAYFLQELSYTDNMTLSKRNVWLMVGLIVVSLTGLVALQASLLKSAMDSKESAFRRNVLAAMGAVAQTLEEQEAMHIAREMVMRGHKDGDSLSMSVLAIDAECELPLIESFNTRSDSGGPMVRVIEQGLEYTLPTPPRILQARTSAAGLDTVIVATIFDSSGRVVGVDSTITSGDFWMLHFRADSAMHHVTVETEKPDSLTPGADSGRVDLVKRVVSSLVIGELRPIAERLDRTRVDSLLSVNLLDAGVDLEYAFAVTGGADDSLSLAETDRLSEDLKGSDLKVQLFPNDIFSDRADLALFFPERVTYLWFQMGPLLGATSLFVAIIIFCFVYSIRTITAQRRNARLMVEFVNNMTHEFKTPISTVALACEAILRPDMIKNETRVAEFSRMIQSENKRMRGQTEKILQMAALEEKDYELSLAEVDTHEVIKVAVETVALQVRSRHGEISCELNAVNPEITADRVHLEAIIHNLLDNANKYSPEEPSITVRTRNGAQGLLIEIEDKGVGLREEDQRRVFEKYFRVSSGDRHDVKGFGLGLSYVDLMMKAHGGRVGLESTFGKGTLIKLVFPVTPGGSGGGRT